MPKAFKELDTIRVKLEKHYRDMQDLEFTIEQGKLYMLQTRNGKRTAAAAVKIAVDMAKEKLITEEEAVLRVDPKSLDQLLHPVFDGRRRKGRPRPGQGPAGLARRGDRPDRLLRGRSRTVGRDGQDRHSRPHRDFA